MLLGGSALLSSYGALDFVLASGCVFLVKLDGICSDESQEVCLEKNEKNIFLLFCWQCAADLNENKKKRSEGSSARTTGSRW